MNRLTFEHGLVHLGDLVLPGVFKNQNIRNTVRFDEAEQDGMSGKVKTPLGWDDAAITLAVELLTDRESSCYEKLAELDSIFKGHDNGGNPMVYDITNPHVTARGIHQVVFSGLDSSESDSDDVMQASLNFTEHNPPIVKVEQQVTASGPAPVAQGSEPEPDAEIMQDTLTIDVA